MWELSVDNLAIPVKSFRLVRYSGIASWISIQSPYRQETLSAFIATPKAVIILKYNNVILYEFVTDDFSFAIGSTNKTISISASYNNVETTPKTVSFPITDINTLYSGKRVFSAEGFYDFDPLDDFIYEGQSVKIDQVSTSSSPASDKIELREQ